MTVWGLCITLLQWNLGGAELHLRMSHVPSRGPALKRRKRTRTNHAPLDEEGGAKPRPGQLHAASASIAPRTNIPDNTVAQRTVTIVEGLGNGVRLHPALENVKANPGLEDDPLLDPSITGPIPVGPPMATRDETPKQQVPKTTPKKMTQQFSPAEKQNKLSNKPTASKVTPATTTTLRRRRVGLSKPAVRTRMPQEPHQTGQEPGGQGPSTPRKRKDPNSDIDTANKEANVEVQPVNVVDALPPSEQAPDQKKEVEEKMKKRRKLTFAELPAGSDKKSSKGLKKTVARSGETLEAKESAPPVQRAEKQHDQSSTASVRQDGGPPPRRKKKRKQRKGSFRNRRIRGRL